MEKRLERLEMLVMEQDATIESLNHEVQKQQLQIQQLSKSIELLNTKLSSAMESSNIKNIEDEAPPPHY